MKIADIVDGEELPHVRLRRTDQCARRRAVLSRARFLRRRPGVRGRRGRAGLRLDRLCWRRTKPAFRPQVKPPEKAATAVTRTDDSSRAQHQEHRSQVRNDVLNAYVPVRGPGEGHQCETHRGRTPNPERRVVLRPEPPAPGRTARSRAMVCESPITTYRHRHKSPPHATARGLKLSTRAGSTERRTEHVCRMATFAELPARDCSSASRTPSATSAHCPRGWCPRSSWTRGWRRRSVVTFANGRCGARADRHDRRRWPTAGLEHADEDDLTTTPRSKSKIADDWRAAGLDDHLLAELEWPAQSAMQKPGDVRDAVARAGTPV